MDSTEWMTISDQMLAKAEAIIRLVEPGIHRMRTVRTVLEIEGLGRTDAALEEAR